MQQPPFWLLDPLVGTVFPNLDAALTLRPIKTLELHLSVGTIFMKLGRLAAIQGREPVRSFESHVVMTTLASEND